MNSTINNLCHSIGAMNDVFYTFYGDGNNEDSLKDAPKLLVDRMYNDTLNAIQYLERLRDMLAFVK